MNEDWAKKQNELAFAYIPEITGSDRAQRQAIL
jgi:hypothetical protein